MTLRARVLTGAVLFAAVAAAGRESLARTPFDGNWSVLVVTERGSCDRAYRYPVRIVDGRVLYAGEGSFTISGGVSRNGTVRVSIRRGNQSAQGSGRLAVNSGRGTWTSPSNDCAGEWSAERR